MRCLFHRIGAVIAHVFPDGLERPGAYASRSLSKSENNYSQIKKEGLAIVYGVKKFHQFLYGRYLTLVTDHKPLVTIFGAKQSIPPIAAVRLQRWAIILSGYRYNIEFQRTQDHRNANAVSRLPLVSGVSGPEVTSNTKASLFNLCQIETLPITAKELAAHVRKNPMLAKVIYYANEGWPSSMDRSDPFHPYFCKKRNCLWSVVV